MVMTNEKQIEELVEKVADEYCNRVHNGSLKYFNYQRKMDVAWQHPFLRDSFGFAKQILFGNNLAKKIKCPSCEWYQFEDDDFVGMTPCDNCNSTGFIYILLEEVGK